MRFFIVVVVLACASPTIPAQPTVRIGGLSVMDDTLPLDDLGHLPLWVGKGGTRVLLAVSSPKSMIELDRKKSTITVTDGQGTDLMKPRAGKKPGFSMGPFGMSNPVSKDGRTMAIAIEAPRAPARGAGRVTCKGTIAVVVASGTKKLSARAAMKPGVVSFGAASVKIESAGKEKNWNDKEVFAIKLAMKGAVAKDFAGFRFLDAAGRPIKAEKRESMSGLSMRSIKYELGVKDLASCTIELSTWQGRSVVNVPFNLTATSPL